MSYQRPTAVVTGGTGYLGGQLAKYLTERGWTVHLLVRSAPAAGAAGLEVHVLQPDYSNLTTLLKEIQPQVVFHLASLFLVDHQPDQVGPLLHSNVVFGTQLLEAMVQAGVSHFVNTGTWWQHYEAKPYSPVCLYAATKQAFEAILQFYTEARGLHAITLTVFDTYGPNDPRRKLLNILAGQLANPQPLDFPVGEQPLDLVYVDDVCAAFERAAKLLLEGHSKGHEIYSLPARERMTLRQVVEKFFEVAGVPSPARWGTRPYRAREMLVPWNAGTPLPGWRAEATFEVGARRLLDAWRLAHAEEQR